MSLIITGVIDGPLSFGQPKAVELYVTADIADLSEYGLGSANNGLGSDGEEFTFPVVAATAGNYIYVANDTTGFNNFMGFAPAYVSSAASINGDDAIELFHNGAVIDLFGDINVDGSGQPWEYLDGWAARKPGSTASATFSLADWTFSGPNALDGETDNATAATAFPAGKFVPIFSINEIDADQTGTDSAEFIEIYDGGIGDSSLDGLSLVLYNGADDLPYHTISLTGQSTDANGFFVVGSASVANVDLVEFTSNGLQNGADAVALYNGASIPANLLDAVVYDTNDADDPELLALLGQTIQYNEDENGAKDTEALARIPDGTGGFAAQIPTPGETNILPAPPVPTDVFIHDIQGNADVSPLDGQLVSIEAIVTADFQDGVFGADGDLNGFFVQEEDSDVDGNVASSEGIFVNDGSAPAVDVAVGDKVQVTGTVAEFFGKTELTNVSVTVVDSNNTLPTATTVLLPFNAVEDLEAVEGMRVNLPQDLTITEMFNLDRFGEYKVSSGRQFQFTETNLPDVAGFNAHTELAARSTIQLDDGRSGQNLTPIRVIDGNDGELTTADSFRMGDTISNITGVLDYSFGTYEVLAPSGTFAQQNPRPATPDDVGGNFKAASLNVLNYFTTLDDGATTDNGSDPRGANTAPELERQAQKLVEAIVEIDADVLGLVELENDFAGGNFAIKDLVDRVNTKLGSAVYGFVDPGQEFIGDDAIANGLIYKVANVGLRGDLAILESFDGDDFIDPLGAGRSLNRPSIAQTFEDLDTGQFVTIAVNHLKSKGSLSGLPGDDDAGDGQGNNNATRTAAATILAAWLQSDPTGQGAAHTLILGDLNAYAMEDPLTALAAAGFEDLAQTALGIDSYTFTFDGKNGTLDHALANEALSAFMTDLTQWHINADEPDAFDYDLSFNDPSLFDGSSPARNSDHDPVIVGFDFENILPMTLFGTPNKDKLDGVGGNDLIRGRANGDDLNGNGGNDVIAGQRGRDKIDGGDGEDLIRGGKGADCLTGGADADTFDFNAVKEIGKKPGKRDVIKDFEQGIDTIDLSDIDAKTPDWADKIANAFGANIHKGNQKFNFVGKKNKFSGVEGELRYEYAGKKTVIKGDTDGNGRSEFKLELTGIHVLDAMDFIL